MDDVVRVIGFVVSSIACRDDRSTLVSNKGGRGGGLKSPPEALSSYIVGMIQNGVGVL